VKLDTAKPVESKAQSTSGIEDLFKDSPAVAASSAPAVSKANPKTDIMSLFEKVSTTTPCANVLWNGSDHIRAHVDLPQKMCCCFLQSNMVSPFAIHQQQLAFMNQQQAFLMAALKSGNAPQMVPGNASLLNSNGSNAPNGSLPSQNWPNLGYLNPSSIPAAAPQNGAAKVMTRR
jgi:stromal membrane-associated protein